MNFLPNIKPWLFRDHVKLGELEGQKKNDERYRYYIEEVIIHPNYTKCTASEMVHDIALMRTKKTINFKRGGDQQT